MLLTANTMTLANFKLFLKFQISNKFHNKHKSLAFFHINGCSFNKNVDDLGHLLKCTNKVFDIIAVTKTRITKQTPLLIFT